VKWNIKRPSEPPRDRTSAYIQAFFGCLSNKASRLAGVKRYFTLIDYQTTERDQHFGKPVG